MNDSLPLQDRSWFKLLLWIVYSIIFFFGVGGNAVVCFILYQRKSLRTVTNLFILNLAVSDLIFSSSIPLEFPIILSNYKWPYASFFCKIYSPVQTMALYVSIITLTAVSVTRYWAIKYPLKRQVSSRLARYILTGIWILAGLTLVPHVVTLKVQGNQCVEEWPHLTYRKMYTTFLFMMFYFIPLFIIVLAYMTIVKELMKKKCYDNRALNEAWNKESGKVGRMLFKVTAVFAICNLPSQLLWLWLDFGNADQTFEYFWDVLTALNILVFANSAANPFIYYICHDRFRGEALRCLSNYKCLTRLRRCWRRTRCAWQGNQEIASVNKEEKQYGIKTKKTAQNVIIAQPPSKVVDKTQESTV